MPMPRDAVGELWGIAQQAAESGPVRIPSQRIVYDTRSSCLPSFLDHDTRSPQSRIVYDANTKHTIRCNWGCVLIRSSPGYDSHRHHRAT